MIVDGVGGIFKMIQGGPSWVHRYNAMDLENASTFTTPIKNLVTNLEVLGSPLRQKELVDAVLKKTLEHSHSVLDAMVIYGEVTEENLPAEKASATARVEALRGNFTSLCSAISTSATECAAMDKVSESVDHLDKKFLYDPRTRPYELSTTASESEVFKYLGIPETWCEEHDLTSYSFSNKLVAQWNLYVKKWKEPPKGSHFTPSQVNDFWLDMESESKELADIALLNWAAPINAAGTERVFSIVTAMDQPHRAGMKEETFLQTLYLRGNRRSVVALATDAALDVTLAKGGTMDTKNLVSTKRERANETALERLHAKASSNPKRRVIMGGDGGLYYPENADESSEAGDFDDLADAEGDD